MRLRRHSTRKSSTRLRNQWSLIVAFGRRWVVRSALAAACGITLAALVWYGIPAALHWAMAHPYFAITKLELDGNRRLTRHDVLEWIGVQEGSSVWDATPTDVQTRLESHPWVAHASVQREFPHRLVITLQERRPAAIVRFDGLNYVDRAGRVLGPLRDDDSPDFPLITGLEDDAARGFALIGVHRALQFLRRCERQGCFDGVSEVHVNQQRGVTVFPQHTTVAVVLGWGGWREKLARSARVLAAWEGQTARVAAVDVSFRELAVVKLREEHRPAARRGPKPAVRV
ncbi:MAG TPA: FtsQ-type POTRA domain-containing protein [Candidatus Margulisiibacteriota bacterium]|nr:FtsQ-type POTRA domain-containing protein [Candidatus Margulisiibacteriota bacterium]